MTDIESTWRSGDFDRRSDVGWGLFLALETSLNQDWRGPTAPWEKFRQPYDGRNKVGP